MQGPGKDCIMDRSDPFRQPHGSACSLTLDESSASCAAIHGDPTARLTPADPVAPLLHFIRRQQLCERPVLPLEFLLAEQRMDLPVAVAAQEHCFPSFAALGNQVMARQFLTPVTVQTNRAVRFVLGEFAHRRQSLVSSFDPGDASCGEPFRCLLTIQSSAILGSAIRRFRSRIGSASHLVIVALL